MGLAEVQHHWAHNKSRLLRYSPVKTITANQREGVTSLPVPDLNLTSLSFDGLISSHHVAGVRIVYVNTICILILSFFILAFLNHNLQCVPNHDLLFAVNL